MSRLPIRLPKLKWKDAPDGDGFYWFYQPAPDRVISAARIWTERRSGQIIQWIAFVDADLGSSVATIDGLAEQGGHFFMGPIPRPGMPHVSKAAEMRRWNQYCKRKRQTR